MKTSSFLGALTSLAMLAGFRSATQPITFDAAAGAISPPFVLGTNGAISQPVTTEMTNGGLAVYTFTLGTAGMYVVSAEVRAPKPGSAFLVNIDAEPLASGMAWDLPVTPEFVPREIGWRGTGTVANAEPPTKLFNLTKGVHQLFIRGSSSGTELRKVIVKSLPPPSAPSGLRVVGSTP